MWLNGLILKCPISICLNLVVASIFMWYGGLLFKLMFVLENTRLKV